MLHMTCSINDSGSFSFHLMKLSSICVKKILYWLGCYCVICTKPFQSCHYPVLKVYDCNIEVKILL